MLSEKAPAKVEAVLRLVVAFATYSKALVLNHLNVFQI